MKFSAKSVDLNKIKSACVVITADSKGTLTDTAKEVLSHCDINLQSFYKSDEFTGKTGQLLTLYPVKNSIAKLIVVGLGKAENLNPKTARTALTKLVGTLKSSPTKQIVICWDDVAFAGWSKTQQASACAQAFTYGYYQFTRCKSKGDEKTPSPTITYHCANPRTVNKALAEGQAIGEGCNVARELGNLPGNICTPKYLAGEAKKLARQSKSFTTQVLSEKQMQALGMHSLLSVSAGSDEPAQLIVMQYQGASKTAKPHVLVGKGITFDTGGISLKPGAAMDEMKFDMCGAASVFGTMHTLAKLQPKINVVAIVAAAENMPSGSATKPGDIVTSMSGQTIEILNTDAEGRLVLCDALTFAEKFKPKSVVDIATLTGACVIALGSHATGLFSNNDELAEKLLAAGNTTDDRAWRMPLWDAYQKQLDSNFADMANIGGREAGSVTAACFLSRFTEKYPWAHLDIAGTAWHSGGNKGATGRPVSLLLEYLLNHH